MLSTILTTKVIVRICIGYAMATPPKNSLLKIFLKIIFYRRIHKKNESAPLFIIIIIIIIIIIKVPPRNDL